jgi:hypothetical protein
LEFAGKPLLANRQIEVIRHSLDFRQIREYADAQQLANSGRLIFACKKAANHGHICFLVPSTKGGQPMHYSGLWKASVPFAANVGRTNAVRGLSYAFRSDDRPDLYIYDPKPKTHIVMEPITIVGEIENG